MRRSPLRIQQCKLGLTNIQQSVGVNKAIALRLELRERGVVAMVCQQLDTLEWEFIQARAESRDLDSLGWTDREFSCLVAILDHKRGGIRANPVREDLYKSEQLSDR
jgi:hypothetical protein